MWGIPIKVNTCAHKVTHKDKEDLGTKEKRLRRRHLQALEAKQKVTKVETSKGMAINEKFTNRGRPRNLHDITYASLIILLLFLLQSHTSWASNKERKTTIKCRQLSEKNAKEIQVLLTYVWYHFGVSFACEIRSCLQIHVCKQPSFVCCKLNWFPSPNACNFLTILLPMSTSAHLAILIACAHQFFWTERKLPHLGPAMKFVVWGETHTLQVTRSRVILAAFLICQIRIWKLDVSCRIVEGENVICSQLQACLVKSWCSFTCCREAPTDDIVYLY